VKADLGRVADRLARQARELVPMQVAGGRLTALQMRRLVGVLELSAAQARMTGRRVDELLRLIAAHGDAPPPPPPRPCLRLLNGGRPDGPTPHTNNQLTMGEA
jgi:hypothetical protein